MKLNFARTTGQLALAHGDREALVHIERGRRYTHRALDRLTNRIVHMMRGPLGLQRGDTYLCILENDNLSLLHVWTALKGEAALAMTNLRDSVEEHRWQVEFLRPRVVFIENALLETHEAMLRELGVTLVCMDPPPAGREGLLHFWSLLEGMPEDNPGIESEVDSNILVYRFTGGTTGRSKCAQYTLGNWLACRDAQYAFDEQLLHPDTRFLHMAPISHGSGLALLSTLFRGGCTVTQNTPDLRQWCKNVERERITAAMMVPTLLYRLLDLPEAGAHDLSSLQALQYGAAPISPLKLRRLLDRFGPIFCQSYGATECLQRAAYLSQQDHVSGDARRLASAGQVAPGMELVIVDDQDRPLPPGQTGEIWLRSRATISGYYNNPEGTVSEFSNGFWKSGDLGYLDEAGYLYVVDRKKDMIISGGFNVYAVEVEAALNTHPAVANSAVVGVPHEEWGEAVHAEVELRAGAQVEEAALVAHVKAHIGSFKAPKSIAFVEALPLSPVGKVIRRQVRQKYWQGSGRQVA